MAADPQLLARMRGGFVGGTCGVVATVAHAVAEGAYPGTTALTVLLSVAVIAGAVAAGTRLAVVPLLLAGQVLGHIALSLGSGHFHLPGPGMLAAHLAAVLVASALIRGAERGSALALNAVRRIAAIHGLSSSLPVPAALPVGYRPAMRRMQVFATGVSTRGPPLVTV
ncbi:hypothetical protein [Rhodococcus sp. (in: high G+C Gram-positive bacteria)]|uniref:hypothetical protein n=1 Tax=Rhodococcus sp. TaxID=1831 RepID=UPI003890E3BA